MNCQNKLDNATILYKERVAGVDTTGAHVYFFSSL